jgi:hypothetical protein
MLHVAQILRIDDEVVGSLAPVQQQVDELAQVGGRRMQIARRPQIDLRIWHRRPVARRVAFREQRMIRLGKAEAARRHTGRLEDLVRDPIFVFLACHFLDHMTGDAVSWIRI